MNCPQFLKLSNPLSFSFPPNDEFLISYRDRSAALSQAGSYRVASVNGIFYPVILVNGQVTGVWKRITMGKKIFITISPFLPYNKKLLTGIEKKIKEYSGFLEKEIEIKRI